MSLCLVFFLIEQYWGVAAVPIMHRDPMKLGQDADGISGGFASLAMACIVGERLRTCRMQPLQHALHPHPRLIGPHHRCSLEGLLDLLFRLDESVGSFSNAGLQSRG